MYYYGGDNMLGFVSEVSFRSGGYITPSISIESNNTIITCNLPVNSRIMCSNCSLENESTLISNGDVLKTTNGYFIKNNVQNLKILRPLENISPLSILKGREILYCDNKIKTINLQSPIYFRRALSHNNQMHVLMGETNSTHYRWDGLNWYSVSELPYKAAESKVISFNNELHIFAGTASGTIPNHYKWNGIKWEKVSTIPNSNYRIAVVVYNNELHMIGPYKATGTAPKTCLHLKLNGNTWEQVSTLPFYIDYGTALVYNGKIHVFGGDSLENHYEWDGTTWNKLAALPILYNDNYGCSVIYNNEIHVLGGALNSTKHYKWNGTNWVDVSTLPYVINKSAACVFDGKIQLISSATSSNKNKHYEWDGVSWKNTKLANIFNLPKGSRVNKITCENNGENIIPEKSNYLIEY